MLKRTGFKTRGKGLKRTPFRRKAAMQDEWRTPGPARRKRRPARPERVVMRDGRTILRGKAYAALRLAVYERDDGFCAICRRHVDWCDYEMDHYLTLEGEPLISRGMGGSKRHDSLETCRTTHEFCNRDRVRKERTMKVNLKTGR